MSELEQKVRQVLEQNGSLHISVDKVSVKDILKDYGLNSIRYMSIIIDLENAFQIKFDVSDITTENFISIEKIIEIIQKYQNNGQNMK